jgi:hypothetical protein
VANDGRAFGPVGNRYRDRTLPILQVHHLSSGARTVLVSLHVHCVPLGVFWSTGYTRMFISALFGRVMPREVPSPSLSLSGRPLGVLVTYWELDGAVQFCTAAAAAEHSMLPSGSHRWGDHMGEGPSWRVDLYFARLDIDTVMVYWTNFNDELCRSARQDSSSPTPDNFHNFLARKSWLFLTAVPADGPPKSRGQHCWLPRNWCTGHQQHRVQVPKVPKRAPPQLPTCWGVLVV